MTISPHRKVGIFFVYTTDEVGVIGSPSGIFLFRICHTTPRRICRRADQVPFCFAQVICIWHSCRSLDFSFAPVLHARQLILHATAKCKCQICETSFPNACAVASVPSVRNNCLPMHGELLFRKKTLN